MNFAETHKLDQPARRENRCGSCGRPWFGLVAYCPYCGREPGFTKISQPGYRPTPADGEAFMQQLSAALQKRGY